MKLTLLCCLIGLALGDTSLRSEDKNEETDPEKKKRPQ